MWRTWFIIHRAKYYSRAVTSCNTHHFGWRIWAPCNVANFQSVLHMLALTCDMELVPGLRDLKTSLLIRHPDEEVGTVPFSFDSDSTLQKICDRLVYQYFEDHITDARLPGTYQNHRNVLEMQLSESSSSSSSSSSSANCTLPTALILRPQTKAHCSLFNSKNHPGVTLARKARRTKTTPSHAFMSLFGS